MFELLLSAEAGKFLDKLHGKDTELFKRFIIALEKISEDPHSAKRLTGSLKGYYSYRLGRYRILYEIDAGKATIYIEKIAHRKEVYR
jgi:mRNA interferase RelE/StbE